MNDPSHCSKSHKFYTFIFSPKHEYLLKNDVQVIQKAEKKYLLWSYITLKNKQQFKKNQKL